MYAYNECYLLFRSQSALVCLGLMINTFWLADIIVTLCSHRRYDIFRVQTERSAAGRRSQRVKRDALCTCAKEGRAIQVTTMVRMGNDSPCVGFVSILTNEANLMREQCRE